LQLETDEKLLDFFIEDCPFPKTRFRTLKTNEKAGLSHSLCGILAYPENQRRIYRIKDSTTRRSMWLASALNVDLNCPPALNPATHVAHP
jgi:hypothetical protein